MNDVASTVNKQWSDKTAKSIDWDPSGPRPRIVSQEEINTTASNDALTAPDPNRSSAQINSGRRAYRNAQELLVALSLPNTSRLTTTVLTANAADSPYAAAFAVRNQDTPLTPKTTMVGTMVRSARMLDVSRVVHRVQ